MGTKLTGLVFSAITMAFGGVAQTPAELYSCSMDSRQSIYWQAIGETVTLRSELFGHETFPPEGRQSIIFSDGHEVVIGEGDKYIDDATSAVFPTCEEYLLASNGATISSLNSPAPATGDITFLAQARPSAKACDASAGRYDRHGGLFCEQWDEIEANFANDQQLYDRLVAQRAPIIAVPYSTAGVDYLVYDHIERAVHPLFYAGG
ncbi:MAG: hypothetical protein AAF683_10030 [Pseudomonadota bacterium]